MFCLFAGTDVLRKTMSTCYVSSNSVGASYKISRTYFVSQYVFISFNITVRHVAK
jgi:hypothetical protein